MTLMPLEKINKIAVKFNMYCSVAEERYDKPKYVFAALLTMLDYLEEKEHCTSEERRGFIKTIAELTKDVSHREDAHREEKEKPLGTIPSTVTLLGVVPKTELDARILEDLVNLGCERLEDIKGIRAVADRDSIGKKFYVMVKSRLARLPDDWNLMAIGALSLMMKEKNLTLAIQD